MNGVITGMENLILIKPSDEYIDEICAYRQEFINIGDSMAGTGPLRRYENISEWLEQCRLYEHQETVPHPNWVEADQYILVRNTDNRVVGMIQFRHYFNDFLREYGGHIGYSTRPSERRKGYAKEMFRLCLKKCWEYGLDRVLITCNVDNEGSRRTILANGGIFERITQLEEENKDLERYWIDRP